MFEEEPNYIHAHCYHSTSNCKVLPRQHKTEILEHGTVYNQTNGRYWLHRLHERKRFKPKNVMKSK